MVTADAVAIPTALWAALALKFDRLDPSLDRTFAYFLVAVASALFFFSVFGLYRAIIRFMGPKAMVTVIAGVSLSVLVLAAFDRFIASHQIPLSAFGIYWALALPWVGGSRFVARYLFLRRSGARGTAARVAIYGAGNAGARVCSALLGGPDFEPVAFIDDKKSLQGSNINGIRVYGSDSLQDLVRLRRIDRILLAMPTASRRRRREILTALEPLGVHVQSLPNLSDLISGKAQISELCDVDVGDLLGRDPVPPRPKLFGSCIRGKCVLVTGAGGSIGSELCRQIVRLSPSRLVLFEMSELALYNIQRELEEVAAHERLEVEIVPLLGNAHHRHRVREVLSAFGVQTVYHAAAYKHVPIVEHNVVEGIHNNVISTWYTAEAALETGVETFVLISTDKAVNPANVMGATKRLAELVLQALRERSTHTRFCIVRFGNVLASSGSVVPLFQEQIRRGGPITVTHPDVIRYFMTIPEAAQLVLQAGSMAKGGDVFVLDMGRPVRIDDLARRLVNLMGLTVRDADHPDGDIEIEYTGLRTAEKLFEELLIGTNVTGTDHPMILRAIEHHVPWPKMQQVLNDLLVALASFDCHRALALLAESVAEYQAEVDIRDYVWTHKAVLPHAPAAKVADFAAKRRLSEAGKPTQGQNPLG
ncbi:MAG TPA: nucleoside-diphosphate sugar epimerase/dehydratase [Steroidobacteraceae bacterium]|jgi:FlaA1/EpsC-like NDP-sugar epimerase|nr:nucleoside-diphosphate sugar epimerase/dehydratase [Steroidobacteraceae bacterium]